MAQGGSGRNVPPETGNVNAAAWAPIISWLREDEQIAEWLTEAEATLLSSDRRNNLPVWEAILEYQRSDKKIIRQSTNIKDLKRTMRNMIKNRDYYMETKDLQRVEIRVRVGDEDRTISYTNRETMVSDMEFLIFFFAKHGFTNRKYTSKSLEEVSMIAGWLIEKYGIDISVNLPLTAIAPDVVTLPRIVACFPAKVCKYYHLGFSNTLATFLDIGLVRPEGLSRSLLCPHFTALLPRELMRRSTTMQYVSFLVHVVTDDILHKKAGNYTDLENILIYYSAEYHNPCTPHDSRLVFCDHMGLLTPTRESFLPILENLRDSSISKIRALRPQDPRLENVIQELDRLV
jgi:hypothetical protein